MKKISVKNQPPRLNAPQYDLLDLRGRQRTPQYDLPDLRDPDSGISASLRQAEPTVQKAKSMGHRAQIVESA